MWLAYTCINLATHPCHSIPWDSNFLLQLALGCLDGFSIRRYEGESFDLLATKFESGVMRFLANQNSFKIAQKTAFEAKDLLYTTGKVIQRLFIIDLYS